MSDKAAQLIQELGTAYAGITTAAGYFNTVAGVVYGEESFNPLGKADDQFPMVKIIINDLTIPDFSTVSCSRTQIDLTVHGYLRKASNRETSLATYQSTLNWAKDLRDAFRKYLNDQNGGAIDADLLDSNFDQSIGYATNTIEVSSRFTLSFDEELGV